MPRITNSPASRKRRKRRLALAKGFYGARSKQFRLATEAVDRAMKLSYEHRKDKKQDFRRLWTMRLSAACRAQGISYSRFIEGLTKAGVELNRKMLSEIAIHDADGFAAIVELAKSKATLAPAKAKAPAKKEAKAKAKK
ncbi:MAG: 50S ribosomal protein L20 [Kiritimatiellia bacterium]|jgi:large subunit ribosomal protein L20